MDTIQLNVINKSNDQNNSEIVIFPKNVATDMDELAVAWQVIQNLGRGSNHPFTYPMSIQVGASDSYGNFTPHLDAAVGQKFQMVHTNSGDELELAGAASSSQELQVLNALTKGTITANVFKAGKLFATRTNIAPSQMAAFSFKPTIWIGVASQVTEGAVMDAAIVSSVNTEFSLFGIASADIVMTGGGSGPDATPFQFTLENVEMA